MVMVFDEALAVDRITINVETSTKDHVPTG